MSKLINNSQVNVVEEIVRNPGINVREIISKTRLSPNFVLKYVNNLIDRGVLREEKFEKKRVYLRRFYFNFKSLVGINLIRLIKDEQRENFFQKYKHLRNVFEQLEKIKGVELVLVYGSYARFAEDKGSDIDVLIVGNVRDKDKFREIFVSLEKDVSLKIETIKSFENRLKDALHQQILKEGVVICGGDLFVEFLGRGDEKEV